MHRTSLTYIAFACLLLCATTAESSPIRYTADWLIGKFNFVDPAGIGGARMHLEAIVDPATATPMPLAPGQTRWSNYQWELDVTGTSHANGTYHASFTTVSRWDYLNDVTGFRSADLNFDLPADIVIGQPGEVFIGDNNVGSNVQIGQLIFVLPPSFSTPAPDGTIFPYTFKNSDLLVQPPISMAYVYSSPDGGDFVSSAFGQFISASAEVVPEPSSSIVALFGLVVCALRRRR